MKPSVARVLFDEAHSEAWTIRPSLAATMQPAHPGDASLQLAAAALDQHGFVVSVNDHRPLSREELRGHDVLVLAHPSDAKWERTTATGPPLLSPDEIDAVAEFVAAGGGLLVLGESEQEKYGTNVNELLTRFGIRLENDTVQDYEHFHRAPSWIQAQLEEGARGMGGDVLARVNSACLYRATTVSLAESDGAARVAARARPSSSAPGAPLIVTAEHGAGRVVVVADSDLFGDDCIDHFDHRTLWVNLMFWLALPAAARAQRFDGGALGRRVSAKDDLSWARLREETNALAKLQNADGSLTGDRSAAARHVKEIVGALERLEPRFEHQADYIEAAIADLRAWSDGGYGKPDFLASLDLFRPERDRRDGIENLVFFPMYKQNGPLERTFEALIIRVPWPDWIAELENTRYDNPKFVPVELVEGTRGYDSECAVLFPEMVSTAQRPVNNFGAIFCDREAARLRRVAGAASELLRLNLPPDAACLLQSPALSQQAYMLWDLIHDRNHSHGDLPFDPFMIRQRAPYWMYALEELRCDLGAFAAAVELETELGFARQVQYAIVLDRLLRFPITGSRVRNYDGLGGQLLFAYLHRRGYLQWTDNRLTIDWSRVSEGVRALGAEINELYRTGIDRSKLAHWAAAHDLVAANVPPAAGSRWAVSVRDFTETEDPRPHVDVVLEDEFPLSLFYSQLKAKLAGVTADAGRLAA